MSPLQQFISRWQSCTKCTLQHNRQHVVMVRGTVPCTVLFVGEAPGHSEDSCGIPFAHAAPAGRILNHIIDESISTEITHAITNIVCCLPVGENSQITQPNDQEIMACGQRLREFVTICSPSLIVCVGKLATEWIDPHRRGCVLPSYTGQIVNITHPAAVLRMNQSMQGLQVQKAIVTIRSAVRRLMEPSA